MNNPAGEKFANQQILSTPHLSYRTRSLRQVFLTAGHSNQEPQWGHPGDVCCFIFTYIHDNIH